MSRMDYANLDKIAKVKGKKKKQVKEPWNKVKSAPIGLVDNVWKVNGVAVTNIVGAMIRRDDMTGEMTADLTIVLNRGQRIAEIRTMGTPGVQRYAVDVGDFVDTPERLVQTQLPFEDQDDE